MGLRFSRRGVALGLLVGLGATLAMVALARSLGPPELLVALFPSLFLWLLLPVVIARALRRRR